jgi:hypothetical protein
MLAKATLSRRDPIGAGDRRIEPIRRSIVLRLAQVRLFEERRSAVAWSKAASLPLLY